MKIPFLKYHGTGNDFVLIDNRDFQYSDLSKEVRAQLCHRRFGIGADGIILLQLEKGYDFRMVYFNSDGNEGTMCGNGGRCITAFARELGLIGDVANFIAKDGVHRSTIDSSGNVKLEMKDVISIKESDSLCLLDTGSPHAVKFCVGVDKLNVATLGNNIRNSPPFKLEGVNVNFVELIGNNLHVRTYERGVEDETYSCGTGVVAAVLAAAYKGIEGIKSPCKVQTPGGRLLVHFSRTGDSFIKIILEGPAKFIFKGLIEI